MKKKLIFLLALFLSAAQFAGAACTYTLPTDEPTKLGINKTGPELALVKPAASVSFQAKRDATGIGNLKVAQYVNNSWEIVFDENPGTVTKRFLGVETAVDYKSYTVPLNIAATKIKFYTEWGSSYSKYYRAVVVTQASYFNVSPESLDFGTIEIGKTSTRNISVYYSNKSISVSSSNSAIFGIDKTNIEDSNCGDATVQVTFTPTTTGPLSATINVGGTNVTVTGTGSLAIPSGLTASNVSYTSANFSWNAVSGASAYLLTNTTNGKTYKVGATSTTISDLVPNNAYTFNVKSLDASDNASNASSPVSINTKAIEAPANLQVSNIDYVSANFSWNAVSGASAYLLTNTTNGKTYKVSATSTTISDLTPDNTYAFNVRALDVYENAYAASTSVNVKTKTIGVPTNLQVSNIGYGSASLSWNAVADAESYCVVNVTTNDTIKLAATTLELGGLSQSTTYQIKVAAVIGEYQSNQASVEFTTKAFGKPSNDCYLFETNATYTITTTISSFGGEATEAIEWGNGVPNMVYFKAKKTWGGFNFFFVQQRIGGEWKDVANPSLSDVYASFAYQLSENATAIRFFAKEGATLSKYITDIQVSLKNSLSVSTTSLDFGNVQIGKTVQRTFTVDYANMADLEIQSDNEYYTVSFDAAPACSLGQRTVTVTYAPKVLDTPQSSSLVVYNGLSATINVTGETTPLAAPLNLRAGDLKKTVLNLSWDAVEGATGYKLSNITTGQSYITSDTKYNVTGLEPFTDYTFAVAALYNDEINLQSESITVALQFIASIGDVVYDNLTDAINAYEDGQEVVLWANLPEEDLIISKSITLDGQGKTIKNLIVKSNGDITITGGLSVVNDFVIETMNGVSGQYRELGGQLQITGTASMDKSLDPSGIVSPKKWYAFSVPFPVSLENGIYRKSGDQIIKMVYGDQYYVQEYDGAKRASTGSGWVMTDVKSTLQPGKFYIFASNGYNDVRFVKTEGSPLVSSQTTLSVSEFASAKIKDTGWNGLANTQLFHVDVNSDVMFAQVYKNGAKEYLTVSLLDESFVVGVPFFIQQGNGMSSVLDLTKRTRNSLRGASENINSIYNLRIATAGGEMSDQLFVSANESASESYVIGKDVEKMGTPTSASTAQLWCVDYDDMNLSVYEAKMKDGAAHLAFRMYAPVAGNYSLYLNTNKIPNDGSTLYLLKDGIAVHNFNNDGEYSFASSKGLISNYELLIKAADDITTVVSENIGNGVFAYIEGDVLYIKNISEFSSYAVGNSIRTLYSGESDGSNLALPVIEKGMYWIKVGNQTIKLIKK
ncbi:MAG: hypothetical protein KBA02_05965 [Paludibacteraceae bacterium]|nr:hypothetical protein [Paludibacteraceae bacterium]